MGFNRNFFLNFATPFAMSSQTPPIGSSQDPGDFTVEINDQSSTQSPKRRLKSLKNVLLGLVIAADFVLFSLDYSGSIVYSIWNFHVIEASKEVSRKEVNRQFFAHFSHVPSFVRELPQSGATDLTIPFKKLKDVVNEAVEKGKKTIHAKIYTDGGHNWSQVSDMLNKCYEVCEYAKEHGVTLIFTVVMVGNYIRYNCWVSVLAFFCKMHQHQCWIVYKETPNKIHQIQQNSDGSTTSQEVDDIFGGRTGENLFANLLKHNAFFDLCSSHTALAYAAAFLNSSECNGMDKMIRSRIHSFWNSLLEEYKEENPAESSAFVFPQSSQISCEQLKALITDYFGTPPRLRVDSKIGMQSLFDYFKKKLVESEGELYVSFAEMVTSEFHEAWLNNRSKAAEIPCDQLLTKSLEDPAFARLLEKMVNLTTIDIAFYNSINNFIEVHFDKIKNVEAISIITTKEIQIVSFLEAVICTIETKRPFFPRMKIGATREEQNAYARLITEVNKWCKISSMSQYGDDGVSLKQILHLVLHNVVCQAVNAGFHGKDKFDCVKEVIQFHQLEESGFLFDLKSAPFVSRYFDRLFEKILADHGLKKKMPQQTEVSQYQLFYSSFFLEIEILMKLKKSSPDFKKFCESFVNLLLKMLSEGEDSCNPERNWKNMQCIDPLRLAFAAVLGLYPSDFDDFLNRQGNEDLKEQMKPVHASRVLDVHCKRCRTYEYVEYQNQHVYYSIWLNETITNTFTHTFEVTDANRSQYTDQKYTHKSRPRTQEELKDKEKCPECLQPEEYDFQIAEDPILQDPRFRTWLIQALIIRGLDTYVDYVEKNGVDKGKKMGKLDSCLNELYVQYQKTEIDGGLFHSVWHLRKAFGETEYVLQKFYEYRDSLADENIRSYFVVDPMSIYSEFTWNMAKFFEKVIEAQEKTKGAIHWSCVLSAFSENFECERRNLQDMHAQEPRESHGNSFFCHVCHFRMNGKEMISEHEEKCLGLIIPLALLIIMASFQNGVLTLGTINESIAFRATKKNFKTSYKTFVEVFNPQGLLKNWWNFGSRQHSIRDIMSRRADNEHFIILVKLENSQHYFFKFDKEGNVVKVFNENSMLFKTDDVVEYGLSDIIPRIQTSVKELLKQ
jgi:hypothetical protein